MNVPDKVIESIILEIGNLNLLPLVNILKDKDNVSEFKLAEKLNTTVNIVRNLLYRLQEFNLVSFTRKKDKKKGWFIYFWTLDKKKFFQLGVSLKVNHTGTLTKRLDREKNQMFYICEDKCVRLDSTSAIEHSYSCPECGKLIVEKNNSREVTMIEKKMKELESEIQEINVLLAVIKEKEDRPIRKAKKAKEKEEKEAKEAKERKLIKKTKKVKTPVKKVKVAPKE